MPGIDHSGRLVKYGLGKETTRGTAAAPTYWLRYETATFDDTFKTIFNQSAIGVIDKYSGAEVVNLQGSGQLAGKVTDQAFGLILYSAFGTLGNATHAGETIVFDHTFSETQTNTNQSLTIARVDPNVQENYVRSVVSQLEISAKAGDFVRHSTDFMSVNSASTSGLTPTFVAENEFIAKHVTAKFAANVAGLGAATAIACSSVKLTMMKNISPYWQIGTSAPGELFNTATEVKGEIVLRYQDNTYKNLWLNDTVQAVSFTIQNTGVTIGNTSNPTLTFTMPACYVDTWKFNHTLDGIVEQTIDFEAVYSLSSAFSIQAILTNLISTY